MTVFSKIQIVLAVLLGPNGLRAGWWWDCGGSWRARVGTWKLELSRARWKEEPEPAVGTALPHRSVLSLPLEDFSLSGLTVSYKSALSNMKSKSIKAVKLYNFCKPSYKESLLLQWSCVCVSPIFQ